MRRGGKHCWPDSPIDNKLELSIHRSQIEPTLLPGKPSPPIKFKIKMDQFQLTVIKGRENYRPLVVQLLPSGDQTTVVTIGRGNKATHKVKCFDRSIHSRMSRQHLSITCSPGVVDSTSTTFTLKNLSRNNIWVNNLPLSSKAVVAIQLNDTIQVVQCTYLLEKVGVLANGVPLISAGDNVASPSVEDVPLMMPSILTPSTHSIPIPAQAPKVMPVPAVREIPSVAIVAPSFSVSVVAPSVVAPSTTRVAEAFTKSKKRTRDATTNTGGVEQDVEQEQEQGHAKKRQNCGTTSNSRRNGTCMIQVADLVGCAACEDIIIDPVVLACAHSLCFVCCHQLSRTINECPTCGCIIQPLPLPSSSSSSSSPPALEAPTSKPSLLGGWCRSVKLDQLVTRYIEETNDTTTCGIKSNYSVRLQEHHQEVQIVSCGSCGRFGHEEFECCYVDEDVDDDEEESGNSSEGEEEDDDAW
jgi:hypothetical protein